MSTGKSIFMKYIREQVYERLSFSEFEKRMKKMFNLKKSYELSNLLDFSTSAWSERKKRNALPPFEKVALLCNEKFINVNELLDFTKEECDLAGLEEHEDEKYSKLSEYKIPVYGFVKAGKPAPVWENPIKDISVFGRVFKKDYKILCVSGDSMFPEIRHGDLIVVNFELDKNDLIDGDPYCVYIPDQGMTVKNLFFHPDKWVFEAANPKFKPFEVLKSEWDGKKITIGRVVWIMKNYSGENC